MANKILITSNNSLFTYNGESLDLFNPPDESNKNLYYDYFKFINSVLAIYSTTRCNGSIPVFWTKIGDTDKLTRTPDHASTLRKLDDKQSYYIILDDNASLPLEVPSPTTFEQFGCSVKDNNCSEINKTLSVGSCCSSPVIINNSYQNIELTSDYIANISIPISGLFPNKKYHYNVSSSISNWPGKIYPSSGFIERSGPTDAKFETSANIELVFSYLPINSNDNISQSIINQDTKNIFTFLNFTVREENCNDYLLQDNINIICNDCLGSLASGTKICPELMFDMTNPVATNETIRLKLNYNNLDVSKNNYYSISSESANWPISISSLSGLIIPQNIYTSKENNKLYGSGSLFLDFTFNTTATEPYSGWSNLSYSLDPNYTAKFIKENIYAILNGSIITETECSPTISRAIVVCDDCLKDTEEYCINNAQIIINETNTDYYELSQQRPGAESRVPLQCCDQDRDIKVSLTNICPDEEYTFKFVVNPYVPITPTSGSFISSSNAFEICALTNLNNLEAANIECIVTHKDTGDSISDSMILRCGYCEWTKVKDLKEIYSFDNIYYKVEHFTDYDIFSNQYDQVSIVNPTNLIISNNSGSSWVAAVPSGYLYVSNDKGINWEKLQKHDRQMWSSLCMSKDTENIYITTGSIGFFDDEKVFFPVDNDALIGTIYKSTDYCNTLEKISTVPSGRYTDIDISNDEQFIVATYETGIIISSDYGSSWSNVSITGADGEQRFKVWSNISITNDGDKIVASHLNDLIRSMNNGYQYPNYLDLSTPVNGRFLISQNGGSDWETKIVPFETDRENGHPVVVKYSKDGSTLAAIGIGKQIALAKNYIYISYDDGNSWYPRIYNPSPDQLNNFIISDDGSRFILYGNNNIYQSKDNGINWTKYTLSSINSDEIISMGSSLDMDIVCSLSQNDLIYSLNLYNCPFYKN